MKKIIAAALAATALMASPAAAEVVYNPATGGTVGKGDVQNAFGWNNAQLQAEYAADSISFRYDTSATYTVTCEWDTVNKKQTINHEVTSTISRGLSANLVASGKQRNQIVGFNVGAAGTSSGGDVPSVGESCGDYEDVDGNAKDGIITSVVASGSGGGGLYVVWNGDAVLLQAAQ